MLAASAAESRALLLSEPPLARAGFAFRRIARRSRGHPLIVRNAEIVLLQPADLVAQPSGFLELQIGGRLAHPLLEVRDVGLEVVTHEMRTFIVTRVDDDSVAGRDMGDDVADVLPDALWRDAMLEVVRLLLLAAAVGLGER